MKECSIHTMKISDLLRNFWKFYSLPNGKFFKDNYLLSIHLPNNSLL